MTPLRPARARGLRCPAGLCPVAPGRAARNRRGYATWRTGEQPTTLRQVLLERLRLWFMSQRLLFLAGFAVIAAGIVCLYLSDKVARTGSWWQGTLDAFGVGFVVGGLIDVLAISGLNRVVILDQRRQENNRRANEILDSDMSAREKAGAATELLRRSENLLSLESRARLQMAIMDVTLKNLEEQLRAREQQQAQNNPSEA
jgi:hypothetical protein